jgi:hypothetical protein
MNMTRKILHQSCWARSASGKEIELFYSINESSPRQNDLILMIGGVHGDEPEGVRLALDLLNWLQKNNSMQLKSWALIPCLNADGFAANTRVNSRGVDLNRNFPTPDWSSEYKAPRYFPGVDANSELETQAVVKLIHELKPNLIIHFHSWKPCVVYTGDSIVAAAANLIGENTVYEIREDIGYPTPGSLGQYGWLIHKTGVVCIEAQENSNLEELWSSWGLGLQRILTQ